MAFKPEEINKIHNSVWMYYRHEVRKKWAIIVAKEHLANAMSLMLQEPYETFDSVMNVDGELFRGCLHALDDGDFSDVCYATEVVMLNLKVAGVEIPDAAETKITNFLKDARVKEGERP